MYTTNLSTPFEKSTSRSWNEHPRPQLKRDAWLSLCGDWSLSVVSEDKEQSLGTIRVPYPPESRLSGIDRQLAPGEKWLYRRSFSLPAPLNNGHTLLHFGAADQIARVWVNGKPAGEHIGGYLPFTLDITDLLQEGENRLLVEITDELDHELPWGKQRRDRGGMWYTPISGIWQPVWLEFVPENYIRILMLTPSLESVTLETIGGEDEKILSLHLPEGDREYRWTGNCFTLAVDDPILWSPENPYLYSFTLASGEDRVESYFALRTVSIERKNGQAYICLNKEPYFFHGLLDQGYFSDGIYTPASPEGYEYDIRTMKQMGFNMLRKHIKIEPECFYYDCDRLGMIVFQDMVNSGDYSFLLDTVLPTIGIKRGISHRASARRREIFEGSLLKTAELLYNHPSVCYYTIFNEGWGQYDADRVYRMAKKVDPTRIWDATSGWFFEKKSDVTSEHVYFKPLHLKADSTRPLVLSEFGGYVYKIPEHSFNREKTYGYKILPDQESFRKALDTLYRNEVIPAIEAGLNAAVLTQVSDVEDETNGLVTYDRQIVKVEEETMQSIAQNLLEAFFSKTHL